MRFIKDPRQTSLFDPFRAVFSEVGYRRVRSSWRELFRESLLALMPVGVVARHFHPSDGRPTKELYSMAGLLLVKEFFNWTVERAVDAYMFDTSLQYALNLDPVPQALSVSTLERYEKIAREEEFAERVLRNVTGKLVSMLELNIERQRLDSTHLHSNMATFGRTRLMAVTIKRFLTQVKRHGADEYEKLPEALRARYAPSVGHLFGDVKKGERGQLRQQVAEDLYWLVERFADRDKFQNRQTYKALVRVFSEQCEVQEERVVVKKKTGGNVVQNPSDPDATYDGHKGPGFQLQLSETCADSNEAQLITAALVQTAAESDQNAVEPVLEALEERALLPKRLDADAAYGSDANVVLAAEKGVDLQSPVSSGGAPDKAKPPFSLNVDDFVIEPETETVQRCPAGCEPLSSVHDKASGETKTVMPIEACAACEFGAECPIKRFAGRFELRHIGKDRRLAGRRREQDTDPFRETYRKRAGIEGTNGGVKRVTGLDRLRVRRSPAVRHAAYLRVAGWNILRAVAAFARRAAKAGKRQADAGAAGADTGASELLRAARKPANRLRVIPLEKHRAYPRLSLAA